MGSRISITSLIGLHCDPTIYIQPYKHFSSTFSPSPLGCALALTHTHTHTHTHTYPLGTPSGAGLKNDGKVFARRFRSSHHPSLPTPLIMKQRQSGRPIYVHLAKLAQSHSKTAAFMIHQLHLARVDQQQALVGELVPLQIITFLSFFWS